jgi:DNA repair protein RecN (Recombination protein N)
MLAHLRVQNLGVLDDVSIDPAPGLTVVTGESGAGKTLLVGGLRLILGEKADPTAVGPHQDHAQADGLFAADDREIGVTRIVPKEGRSRCLVDGALVSTHAVSDLVGELVEIVAQHDHLSLRRPSQVLALIDDCLDEEGRAARESYDFAWSQLQELEQRRKAIGADPQAMARELDLLRYQTSEIENARLQQGEDESLEAEAARLRNLEEIAEHLSESARLVSRLSEDGGEVVSRLRKVSSLDQTASQLAERAEGVAATVAELATEIRGATEGLDVDPARQEQVESRLTTLGDLKRKYGRTLEEVLEFGLEAAARAAELGALAEDAELIEDRMAAANREVSQAAAPLRRARENAVRSLVTGATEHLAALGMERAVLDVHLTGTEPGPGGADRAELWFASDPKLERAPLASAASGGELSRLVLAVRLATRRPVSTTLVFDEIDAGVGGGTALALGRRLAELAQGCQVLCVTHLAQVAAQAETHYAISREGATATVRQVTGDDRLTELARMIAGSPESAPGRRTARELLQNAGGG